MRRTALVVGLGNPGPEYAGTRHNIGFDVVEGWAARHGLRFRPDADLQSRFAEGVVAGRRVAALLPQTFVNRSGRAVVRALERLAIERPEDLLVVYDDLDLPLGRIRLRPSGGSGGHRGLGDIQERVRRTDIPRLRIGIGRPASTDEVTDFVLSPFPPEQEHALGETLELAVDAIQDFLDRGTLAAMNRVNAPPREEREPN